MFSALKKLSFTLPLLATLFTLGSSDRAQATPIDPGTTYGITTGDGNSLFSLQLFSNGSTTAAYTINLFAGAGSTLNVGNLNGSGQISNILASFNNIFGVVVDSNGSTVSNLTSGQALYSGNNIVSGGNGIYGDVQGVSNSGSIVVNAQGTNGVSLSLALTTNYMPLNAAVFAPAAAAFPNANLGAIFGNFGTPGTNYADYAGHGWVMGSNLVLNGVTYGVKGDFNIKTTGSPIPEPATMGLLGMGLLSAYRRRRIG